MYKFGFTIRIRIRIYFSFPFYLITPWRSMVFDGLPSAQNSPSISLSIGMNMSKYEEKEAEGIAHI